MIKLIRVKDDNPNMDTPFSYFPIFACEIDRDKMNDESYILESFMHSIIPGIRKWVETSGISMTVEYSIHLSYLGLGGPIVHWSVALDKESKFLYDLCELKWDENTGELI